MKKIMSIIISVVFLFSSCSKSAPIQIDPSEEFNGITFGMAPEELISFLEKEPDIISKTDDGLFIDYIEFWNEEHFNVSNAEVMYCFTIDTDILDCIVYFYCYDESEQEQVLNDYKIIKEEILRRYPEEIWTYSYNNENDEIPTLIIHTENREILLCTFPDMLKIGVMIEEHHPENDTSE